MAGDVRHVLWQFRYALGLSAIYTVATFGVAMSVGEASYFLNSFYPGVLMLGLFGTFVVYCLARTAKLAFRDRDPRPFARNCAEVRSLAMDRERMASVVLILVVLFVSGSAFSSYKAIIPQVHHFTFDPLFAEIDRVLHFGTEPWHLTHAVLGSTAATTLVNIGYHLWFAVLWVFLVWQLLAFDAPLDRLRFFIAFVLLLIFMGSLTATLLSSAGPVYYGAVTGLDDPFGALNDKLAAIDAELRASDLPLRLWALDVQRWLWHSYKSGSASFGAGISAMPSMHVAVTFLIALSARKISRSAGRWALGFAIFIQIGAVHLGWHYAIDGYLSIICTLIIWKAAKYIALRSLGDSWSPQPSRQTERLAN